MDYVKYLKTQNQVNELTIEIETLQELERAAKRKQDDIRNECSHDYVFIYAQQYDSCGLEKHGECLICGKMFYLDNDYQEWETNELIKCKNLIDATTFANGVNQRRWFGNKNVLLKKAQERFNQLLTNEYLLASDDYIKEEIKKAVLEFDEKTLKEEKKKQKI